jgi:hypothetical protein
LISLFKSQDYFVEQLNLFFEKANSKVGYWYPSHYYWHGNQPDIHAVYLFNSAGLLLTRITVYLSCHLNLLVPFRPSCKILKGLQVNLCLLCLPPGFPAVPQYLYHTFSIHSTYYAFC